MEDNIQHIHVVPDTGDFTTDNAGSHDHTCGDCGAGALSVGQMTHVYNDPDIYNIGEVNNNTYSRVSGGFVRTTPEDTTSHTYLGYKTSNNREWVFVPYVDDCDNKTNAFYCDLATIQNTSNTDMYFADYIMSRCTTSQNVPQSELNNNYGCARFQTEAGSTHDIAVINGVVPTVWHCVTNTEFTVSSQAFDNCISRNAMYKYPSNIYGHKHNVESVIENRDTGLNGIHQHTIDQTNTTTAFAFTGALETEVTVTTCSLVCTINGESVIMNTNTYYDS